MLHKHTELSTKLETRLTHYDKSLDDMKTITEGNTREIEELGQTNLDQQHVIEEMRRQIEEMEIKTKQEHLEILRMTNSIEAHQRKWAIRLLGLEAPGANNETTNQAKLLVLDVLRGNLELDGVTIEDIDCAHHVGQESQDGKQTMLVRFFARDLVQMILKNRRMLKGSQIIIYEDCPLLNRKLQHTLQNNPDIESAWCGNGAVWAKPIGHGKKVKFLIGEEINDKLAKINRSANRQPRHPSSTPRNHTPPNSN
jgi:hypothetical protein